MSASLPRLPISPLRAEVDRHGWPSRRQPHVARLYRAYLRAVTAGTISWRDADEICVRVLGRHPSEVYGDQWHALAASA
jgi:hypothetical protein